MNPFTIADEIESPKPEVDAFDSFLEDDNGDRHDIAITLTYVRLHRELYHVRLYCAVLWYPEFQPFYADPRKRDADIRENIRDHFNATVEFSEQALTEVEYEEMIGI
jgi:hypothetical protein